MLVSLVAHSPGEAAFVRMYNPATDYKAARRMCAHNWEALVERSALCGGDFEAILLAISMGLQEDLKAKVLVEDAEVIGLVLYASRATPLFSLEHDLDTRSGAELSYIVIDNNYQGKGYGGQLFGAMVKELQEEPLIKTIFSRVSATNEVAIDWHIKQGFIRLTADNARTVLEEDCRLEGELYGYLVFRLDVQNVDADTSALAYWRKYLTRYMDGRRESAEQKILGSMAQDIIAHRVAERCAAHAPQLSEDERAYVAQQYLKLSLDRQGTLNVCAYHLGKERRDKKTRKSVEAVLNYIDDHLDALNTEINSGPEVERLLDRVHKVVL